MPPGKFKANATSVSEDRGVHCSVAIDFPGGFAQEDALHFEQIAGGQVLLIAHVVEGSFEVVHEIALAFAVQPGFERLVQNQAEQPFGEPFLGALRARFE